MAAATRPRLTLSWLPVLLAATVPAVTGAATIHVPADAPTIQAGIDLAAAGDTVLVAPGIYTGSGNTEIDFGGTDLVLLSEAGAEETVIDCGTQALSHGLLFTHGETGDAVVDGLTVHRCTDRDCGGAIISASSPTLRNCVFSRCQGEEAGGGACIAYGSPTFVNCTFRENRASMGGAIVCSGGSLSVIDCSFVGNVANFGSAILCESAELTVEGCTFGSNHLGEVLSVADAEARITDCTLHANRGPGIRLDASTAQIENTVLAFSTLGEAVSCSTPSSTAVLSCCDIFGNAAGDRVGCIADQLGVNGNISEDPLFCDAEEGDLTLDALSPCAPENSPAGCGLIGAWPVGCGVTAVADRASPPSERRLAVRPNPVLRAAEFVFDRDLAPGGLEIYDAHGRLVDTLGADLRSGRTWIPPTSAPAGIDFARLKGPSDSSTVKFLVLR